MRAKMRPRGAQEHPKGAQEAPWRRLRAPKKRPRPPKRCPREAQEIPKPLQNQGLRDPTCIFCVIFMGSSVRKAPGSIFDHFLRCSCARGQKCCRRVPMGISWFLRGFLCSQARARRSHKESQKTRKMRRFGFQNTPNPPKSSPDAKKTAMTNQKRPQSAKEAAKNEKRRPKAKNAPTWPQLGRIWTSTLEDFGRPLRKEKQYDSM